MSTCEPGRNAFTPMSTDRPPLTRPTIVPFTISSRSQAALISSQIRILSAFSLESTTMPVSFSRLSISTSTESPAFTDTSPRGLLNSEMGICPSDLYPMSTTAYSLVTWTMVPLTISPSLRSPSPPRSLIDASNSDAKSSSPPSIPDCWLRFCCMCMGWSLQRHDWPRVNTEVSPRSVTWIPCRFPTFGAAKQENLTGGFKSVKLRPFGVANGSSLPPRESSRDHAYQAEMDRRALILIHDELEGAGLLETALRAAGFQPVHRFRCLEPGDGSAPLLVAMGGSMAAYETERHPFLAAEIALLKARLAEGRPSLGICLGAQLLAAAAGAQVRRGRAGLELGVFPVSLTAEAGSDAVFADLP